MNNPSQGCFLRELVFFLASDVASGALGLDHRGQKGGFQDRMKGALVVMLG